MIKKFESFDEQYLKIEDIEDIFIDLTDYYFNIEFLDKNASKIGEYYFILKKSYSEDYFDYIDKGKAYGVVDIENIRNQINKSFDILEETKKRLNSMNYTIAYDLEFSFSAGSYINITCHMQHKKYDTKD